MSKEVIDIYFDSNYGKLYEKAEHGVCEVFEYEDDNGKVCHQFIKREIPQELLHSTEKFYDIVTPYGYGGPVIVKAEDKKKLVNDFFVAFAKYCEQQNIVSEFVRFHPIVNNALDFKEIYNATWDRKTLGTNLKDYDDPVKQEFSKSCRKSIRQTLKKEVEYRIIEKPFDLSGFKKVYYDTMDRNDASEYYYFDDEYFEKIQEWYRENLLIIEVIFEGQVIAAGLYFLYNKMIHVHLSGTLKEYLHLSPAYILRYALTCWAKEKGYEYIHHGGGRTNKEDDALYLFKKQFASNTQFDFYLGRKIWMPEKYIEICRQNQINPDQAFFPAYRSRG